MILSRKIKELRVGDKYGHWTILGFSHVAANKGHSAYWDVRCDCGVEKKVSGSSIRTGGTLGCNSCSNKRLKQHKNMHVSRKHLYFFMCGEYFKIGSSDNVKQRLQSIQAACPYPVKCAFVLENMGHLEKEFHERYKGNHHSGEWFYGGSCDIV